MEVIFPISPVGKLFQRPELRSDRFWELNEKYVMDANRVSLQY